MCRMVWAVAVISKGGGRVSKSDVCTPICLICMVGEWVYESLVPKGCDVYITIQM